MTAGSEETILLRTARGAGWMIAWRLATRLLGLASTLLLVRLLAPGDFGLVALAFSFAAALEACMAIGVETQIIRARDPSRALYDTAFTLNLLRGLALAVLVAALAAPAAAFFEEPRLEAVMFVLALLPAIGGLTSVGIADFQRALDFSKEFRLMLLPRLLQVVATVSAAFALRSYWALLIGIFAERLARVAMSYAMHPYRPRLSLSAWRELAGFSFWVWAGSVAMAARDRLEVMVVGRTLGTSQVGIYTVSIEIAGLPMTEVVGPISRACMPGFAATLRADADAADAFVRVTAITALVALPAGFGISLVAGPLVALALGQTWREAAILIQYLGIGYVSVAFMLLNVAMLTAYGYMRQIFLVTLMSAAIRVGLLLLFVTVFGLGLRGVGLGSGLALLAESVVLMVCVLAALDLRPRALIPHLWRPVAGVAVMTFGLWWLGLGWAPVPTAVGAALWALLLGAGCGAAIYAATVMGLWLASGRPAGAESDMLELLRRVAGGLVANLRFRAAGSAGSLRPNFLLRILRR